MATSFAYPETVLGAIATARVAALTTNEYGEHLVFIENIDGCWLFHSDHDWKAVSVWFESGHPRVGMIASSEEMAFLRGCSHLARGGAR